MSTYTRKNAWATGGGTFSNPDLLWYAKGVGAMMALPLSDRNSWWFFAAIHGEYVRRPSFPGWGFIPGVPRVPTSPLPPTADQATYWNQCQHQSWYFPPWHRGYLIALEAQIRAAVIRLGGPSTWALPYWNYFGGGNEYTIPPAFQQTTLPDGTTNPLFVTARYGPNNNGRNIYVRIPPASQAVYGNTVYTGSNAVTPRPGFGGPTTGFHHGGGTNGNLEANPHNLVHVDVGGSAPTGGTWGLMSDPGIAALDPIFYLHHANIDRMWAAWNGVPNANPSDASWLNGPTGAGERRFVVPMPGGVPWNYTPRDVDSLSKLNYTYDNLRIPGRAVTASQALDARLKVLGAAPAAPTASLAPVDTASSSELVGANEAPLPIHTSGAHTTVKLNSAVRKKLSANLAAASTHALPDRTYLQLENVRGTRDAHRLDVYVNDHLAGSVALFGLLRASEKDGEHGGAGLTFELDITPIVDALHVGNELEADELNVQIRPDHEVPEGSEITVGRVSVHRESHKS